jgi:hypothetical protein
MEVSSAKRKSEFVIPKSAAGSWRHPVMALSSHKEIPAADFAGSAEPVERLRPRRIATITTTTKTTTKEVLAKPHGFARSQ